MDRNFRRQRKIERQFRRLVERLESNDPESTMLDYGLVPPGSSVAVHEHLGTVVGQSQTLKELDASRFASVEKLEAFCRGLRHNRSIEKVAFDPSMLAEGVEVLSFITSFLCNNPNLKTLKIIQFRLIDLSDENWNAEFEGLQACFHAASTKLKSIWYTYSSGDESAEKFCALVKELSNLEELTMNDEHEYRLSLDERSVVQNVSHLVENPLAKLRHLELRMASIDNDAQNDLLGALAFNTQLRHLLVPFDQSFIQKLVDVLRFNNHTLESVSIRMSPFDEESDDDLEPLLHMNRWENKEEVRMRKILDYDFLVPSRPFSGKPFEGEDFDIRLLPFVLSSIGVARSERDDRDECFRRSALFHFVGSLPMLVVRPRGKNSSR